MSLDTVQNIAANDTITSWNSVVLCNSVTAITVTLPASTAISAGQKLSIRNINSGIVTIAPAASNVYNGLNALSNSESVIIESTSLNNAFSIGARILIPATPTMIGATNTVVGIGGLVPQPIAGQQGSVLAGDGTIEEEV